MIGVLLLLAAVQEAGPPPLADLLERARGRLEASDAAGARRDLGLAEEAYPGSPLVANFQGVLEAQEGRYEAAEKLFREAVRRAPRYTDAYLNLGRLCQENAGGDGEALRKARAAYDAVLQYQPDHAEARYQRAAVSLALGDFALTLEDLGRLPPADRERPAVLALLAAGHAARGDRAEADRAAERLLGRRDLAEEDVRLALPTLTARGREDLAVRLLEALRAKALASTDSVRRLGLLYEGAGRLAEAREALEASAGAAPPPGLLLELARVAHAQGDRRAALGYLARARDQTPEDPRVHFFFGMVCVELDLAAEAYNSLKEAVRLAPDDPRANYALGAVALHRRDPSEAIPYFRKYAELVPADRRAALAVGVAAYRSGDFPTARTELLRAAGEPSLAAAAFYHLARVAREEERLDDALALAGKSVEADPRYPDPYSELGFLHLRRREPEEAERALARCLELDGDHYLGNYHLLMLYQRTKDPREEAQAARSEALKRRRERESDDFLRLIEVRPY